MNLCETKIDESVIIDSVNINGKEMNRFLDLGIMPGVKIKRLFNSMFNDPVCYQVKGMRIAIRNGDAKKIGVINE